MKANIETQPTINLQVNRDGLPDQSYLRAQRIEHMSSMVVTASTKLTEAAGRALSAFVTPIALEWHDARTGDHLRDEYFAKKRQVASDEIRKILEL